MAWSNEKIFDLIQLFEKKEILWKKNDKNYHNIVKKEDAWREIGEIMGEEISVIKSSI